MPNEYRYGAYGDVEQSVAQSSAQSGTAPVYVGTAPVNLIRGYAEAKLTGWPVKLSNLTHAQKTVGYAGDWATFTLCEAIAAHFDNTKGNIGPIYVINVLDPDVHKKAQKTTRALAFSNGRCEFASTTIVLDSFALADKAEGVDYTLDYNFTTGTVVVASADPDSPLTGSLDASFYEIDPAAVKATDIIGGVTGAGVYSGLAVLKLMFPELSTVPNLILAPGWSHIPAVYNAMITASQKINGHWYAYALADIPIADDSGAAIYKPEGRCNVSGEVVRETRERAGLSQEQLAARIQLAGLSITQKAISRIETGDRVVADYELEYLADALGVTVNYLLKRTE